MDPQPLVEIFQPPNDTQEGCIDVANITKQESVPKSTYNIAKSNNKIAISKVISDKQWCSVQQSISLVNTGVIQMIPSGGN